MPPWPKEKEVPWAGKERDSGPDIVLALVDIGNSVMESNNYLASLADYIEQLEWSEEEDESDKEPKEWE